MKKQILLVVIILGMLQVASGQFNVFHVGEYSGTPARNGAMYVLPRTVLKVDVVVRVAKKYKGPYSEYARFLGVNDAINYDVENYYLQDVVVNAIAEPDPAQVYFVEAASRDAKDYKPLLLETNSRGFLMAAGTSGSSAPSVTDQDRQVIRLEVEDGVELQQIFHPVRKVNTTVDTIVRRVTVDTAVAQRNFYRIRASDKSTEEMALEALQKIEEIRTSRLNLLIGFQETAYQWEALKYMDAGLQKLENDYLDLFRGKTVEHLETHTFYHTPSGGGNTVLFKFSEQAGVGSVRGATGTPVELQLTAGEAGQKAAQFAEAPVANRLAYRVPGTAWVKVVYNQEEFFYQPMAITQFGAIRYLPPQPFDATFDPETGALRKLRLE
ncbi:MAG: DUF4831 family protein [Bacteroidales bacterium]|nr:DUF4831 family protein [Bacteroidales bacterium]NCU36678.1 DUF4831 family protein [Candidatus Falkowbacteria bacterium]MDD3131062.1 DUF4831 family protein [Bacteroidales bacterium]MDD4175937.1 DUF4831 family protein [Bacteroidales bacterium]MDD4740129.1 DUF4831 family protein [Bacteroidales bacterium]